MDILKKYFNGELTPMEEVQVQRWLVEHADDPQVVKALDGIMSEQLTEDITISSQAFETVSSKLGLDRQKPRSLFTRKTAGKFLRAAIYILLPVLGALGYGYLNPDKEAEWLEVQVPYGQTEELTLADGTHLRLNAGSRVTYPSEFLGDERRIFVDGEVFAEVAKNPEQPFIIASRDIDVKVLGTTFSYKAYGNTECVELILLEGSVQMDIESENRNKELTLVPGEMVQYDRKTGQIELKNFEPSLYRSFYDDNAIHFFNIRLSDIAKDLERIFGTKIVILNEPLAATRYLAWFTNNETLEEILQGININNNIKFYKKDDVIYISKK